MRIYITSIPVADYDKALRIDPEYAEAYLNRGRALLASGKPNEAERDFEQFLTRRPGQQAQVERAKSEAPNPKSDK